LICEKKAWYNFAFRIWTQIILIKNNSLTISNEFSFPSCLFFHPTKIFKEKNHQMWYVKYKKYQSPNMIYSKIYIYHCTWMKIILSKFKIIECKISFFNNSKTLLPFVKQSKLFFFLDLKTHPNMQLMFSSIERTFHHSYANLYEHYYKMHPNSLWVSLHFEWIWTFLPSEIV